MVMITAHGGAMKTGRNSKRYFDSIDRFGADAIEVDVHSYRGRLYVSHLPSLLPRGKISLEHVFDIVYNYKIFVNCDIKERGLAPEVAKLAKQKGVADYIIFTGSVTAEDCRLIDVGAVWLNNMAGISYKAGNAAEIRARLDEIGNPHVVGLNVSKCVVDEAFVNDCAANGVPLSVYTLTSVSEIEKMLAFDVANVTTDNPVAARAALSKLNIKGV